VNIRIDTLAYSNQLRHLPPEQKLWFALAALLLALVTHYPTQIAIFLWMSIWIVIYARIPYRIYLSMLAGVLLFMVTSLPALVLEYTSNISPTVQADCWWQMPMGNGQIYLSQQGSLRAMAMFMRSLASTSALFFIVLTVPAIELASTCQKIGCPPILIELSLLVYRFIFLLADTAQKIITAQVARGGYRSPQLKMNSLNLLVRQLIQRTASRYQQLILSVQSRGFQQEFRFWQPQIYQYSARYAREAVGGCLVLAIGEILYRVYV
jgi:cobalt/nickel transport system permease protein